MRRRQDLGSLAALAPRSCTCADVAVVVFAPVIVAALGNGNDIVARSDTLDDRPHLRVGAVDGHHAAWLHARGLK